MYTRDFCNPGGDPGWPTIPKVKKDVTEKSQRCEGEGVEKKEEKPLPLFPSAA